MLVKEDKGWTVLAIHRTLGYMFVHQQQSSYDGEWAQYSRTYTRRLGSSLTVRLLTYINYVPTAARKLVATKML